MKLSWPGTIPCAYKAMGISLADLAGTTVWQRVKADADSALESGARGTPTLFVDGREIEPRSNISMPFG